MRNTILIIIVLGFLSSCNIQTDKNVKSKITEKVDSSFYFKIRGATNYVSSKSGVYSKKYCNKTLYANFELSTLEINSIEELFFKKELDTLPNNFALNCPINIIPSFEEEIIIMFSGKQKNFFYNDDYECEDSTSKLIMKNQKMFIELIEKILHEKKEIIELENSDIIYF